ncbi:LOW QUALITY PROTEIN: hypothetical protein JCM24511_02674 [Saitozyma sp. JCM 24511]|nr:LOW QUALITY PROTEIN: hypothetical protein JCM24511_02674 [Saitozyma sp. JCM 24511]
MFLGKLALSSASNSRDEGGDAGDLREGAEVFGLAYGGAYAEYIAVSTKMEIRKPPQLFWVEAAGIPETWITALQAHFLVGCFRSATQFSSTPALLLCPSPLSLSSRASAVFITAGSDEKVAFCEQLGVTKGFNYRTQDWGKGVLDASGGRGEDVVVDFIGKDYAVKNFEIAAIDGRIVQLASPSGSVLPAGLDIGILERKRLRWEGSRFRSRDLDYQSKLRDLLVDKALPRFADGTVKVLVERVFDWGEVRGAHELMEKNESKGKIIYVWGPGPAAPTSGEL